MSTAADTATILIMAVVLLAVGYWFGSWIAGQEQQQLDDLIWLGPDLEPEPVELAAVEELPNHPLPEVPEDAEEAPTGVMPAVQEQVPQVLHQIRYDLVQIARRMEDLEGRLDDLEARP